MTLDELRNRVEERYLGELKKAKERVEWLNRRVGTGGGTNQTYLGGPTGFYERREADPVFQYLVRLRDAVNSIRKDVVLSEEEIPLNSLINTFPRWSESGTRETYLDILNGSHPAVQTAESLIMETRNNYGYDVWGFRLNKPKVNIDKETQWDLEVRNPVEERPSILFPDAREYKTEMKKLAERFGGK